MSTRHELCDAFAPRVVYTDGSCSSRTRIGGWAWVCMEDNAHDLGHAEDTTNQRMELTAAYEAVCSNDGPLFIFSDSSYVVSAFTAGWWVKWKRNGWKNYQRKPVANRDLWEPFIDLVVARKNVQFCWIKGHAGDPGNEEADRLAAIAAAQT